MNVGRLGVGDDHAALHDVAHGWAARHCPPEVARACLDGAPAGDSLPPFWDELVGMGWLGLHLPDALGGEGYGLLEAGIVLEELGRACAPGPYLPTVTASALLHRLGGPGAVLRALAGGTVGACGWGSAPLDVDDAGRVTGRADVVPGAALARWLVLPVRGGWADARASVDDTRRVGDVVLDGAAVTAVLDDPDGLGTTIAARLWSAEALGVAAWCVETAASYATMREQFGRPIGQFQGVKHRCADMLLTLERARAAVWDALRAGTGDDPEGEALVSAVAAALAPEAGVQCAKDCIQVLGGVGFTWEHDAHLYLKRALVTRSLAGPPARWRGDVFARAHAGARRRLAVDLPPDADAMRTEVRAFLSSLADRPKSEWRAALADAGYLAPHWPKPWGRDAGAVEQLVIDDEMAGARVRRHHLQIGGWVLPTLIAHGSAEQQQRFVPATLRGELAWCQLFSEPGAGSDLASLSTKASRVDGGWLLTGQKVWTSMAAEADWGICLARTDPTVPKHEGITCFLVDMASEGIELRPLRELTGQAMFNEVFLSDVFVPDECVVGAPGAGWGAARTTLANERVSMGSGSSFGLGTEMVLGLVDPADGVAVDEAGALLAESLALAALGLRMTARALSGAEPGPESSVRKLLGVEHDQRVQELGLTMLGRAGAAADGDATGWLYGFLANRCLTIAGGTSEVQRNVIAERLLGLPRDP